MLEIRDVTYLCPSLVFLVAPISFVMLPWGGGRVILHHLLVNSVLAVRLEVVVEYLGLGLF